MGTLWQDIRYGLRMLARTPGFTAVVVIILGIGIGATTIMLSVVDAVMLRPCPYKDPDTLVCLWEVDKGTNSSGNMTSQAGFRDWRDQSRAFEQMVGVRNWDCTVRSTDRTEKTRAMHVSPGFFTVLGLRPVLGRTFLPEEEKPGGERVVVLSYSHWRRYFGADPDAIGRTLILDQQVYTVVGVLPQDFRWVLQRYTVCGLWVPASLQPDPGTSRVSRGTSVLARLKPGVSVAQAQAEMDLVADRLTQAYPDSLADTGIAVVPIRDEYAKASLAAGQPRTIMILLGTVIAVLLIACLHVASLLIARSAVRDREVAVRAALGARRLRLVRQLLCESALLAGLGGLLGLVLAYWGTHVISAARSQSVPWYLGDVAGRLIPWFIGVRVDGRTLFYVGGISLLTCMFFGTLPALSASKTGLSRSLSAGRTPSHAPRFHRLRAGLVAADIAMAFVLLAGAGLLVNSYVRILNIDPQFDPKNVLSMDADLDWQRPPYSDANRRLAFFRQAVQRIGGLPAARYVAAAGASPITGSYSTNTFEIEGLPPGGNRLDIPRTKIMADYFRVLRVPLLRGRLFTEQEVATSAPVVIINEAMARRCWPDENPLGQHITRIAREGPESVSREVVGVVGNTRHSRYALETPQVYLPGCDDSMVLLVRTASESANLATALRREVVAIDPEVAVSGVTLLENAMRGLHSQDRFNTLFLGAFAAAALVLACLGVYGTTAYAVSRRTHEIGIRMALGARSRDILRAVLGQGLRLTSIGLALGLPGALAATRIIRSLLYEVSPTDPLTFVSVAVLLAGVALLASYVPARRAARIDPMVALRYE
jgi:putative ABC transport system permease protein